MVDLSVCCGVGIGGTRKAQEQALQKKGQGYGEGLSKVVI